MPINTQIQKLQSELYEDLASPAEITESYIGDWLINNVGRLNTYIDTTYSGIASSGIDPLLGQEESDIYKKIFQSHYYQRLIKSNLGANAYEWTRVQEGDSVVARATPTQVAQSYGQLKKENDTELKELVAKYRINNADPLETSQGFTND